MSNNLLFMCALVALAWPLLVMWFAFAWAGDYNVGKFTKMYFVLLVCAGYVAVGFIGTYAYDRATETLMDAYWVVSAIMLVASMFCLARFLDAH